MTDTQLLQWDEDELLVEIGKAASEIQKPLRPPTRTELKEIGARWVQRNMNALRKTVCSDLRVREILMTGNRDVLFELVCEVILHVAAGIPVGCVAAFLVKRSIERLCNEAGGSENK